MTQLPDAGSAANPDGIVRAADTFSPNGKEGQQPVFGRVATPSNLEATSDEYAFWVPEGTPVERTQIVCSSSSFPGVGEVTYYSLVEEVARRSRRRDVLEERDRYDGVPDAELLLDSGGVTYARTRVITSVPPLLTPPREESRVWLAGEADARVAYGVDDMVDPMPFGLLKNGASGDAGLAYLDLADVLGHNGAHINVTGISGAGTKSSTLTTCLRCVLHHAANRANRFTDPLLIVPIVLNVKGTDLMYLQRPSRTFLRREGDERVVWDRLGIAPDPFGEATFFAPQQLRGSAALGLGTTTTPYSWGLIDLVEQGLVPYLFSEEDREDDNFIALVTSMVQLLTQEREHTGRLELRLADDAPARTLDGLLGWLQAQVEMDQGSRAVPHFAHGTWAKLYRRLLRVVHAGSGVVRRNDERGAPLDVTATETVPPRVIDVQSIADPTMQRFVVGALLRQIADSRTGPDAMPGLRYVVVLDELNRWAPRGGRDPITRMVEHIAAEMRSQGIVLFGAQQQASQVSEKVIENASVKLLGRTGAVELEHALWRGLPSTFRRMVGNLRQSEKVVMTPSARQPMVVRMPFPPWAMRREEAAVDQARRSPAITVED